ncbi:unnamed protein product [Cochlearia groenlandica]
MMSQEKREIPKEDDFLPSKETEISIPYVPLTPPASQEPRENTTDQACSVSASKETELLLFEVTVSPSKKRGRDQDSEETEACMKKKTELRLSSVSSTVENEEIEDPEKVSVSTDLCLYDETWPSGNPDVTCEPRNQETRVNGPFILQDGWHEGFVNKSDLKVGDKIGLSWDHIGYKVDFCLISRAPAQEKKPLNQ